VYQGLVAAGILVEFKLIPLVAFPVVRKGSHEYHKLDKLTAAMEAITDAGTHDLQFPGQAATPELQSAYSMLSVVSGCDRCVCVCCHRKNAVVCSSALFSNIRNDVCVRISHFFMTLVFLSVLFSNLKTDNTVFIGPVF
jgi:hypothetical protein